MKKKQIFWASVFLLLSCASVALNADLEEDEDYTDTTDAELPPLKLVNPFCAYKADNGPCRAMLTRFYFNILTQQCEEFMYGGCEGNENRFISLEECKEKCTIDYHKSTGKAKATLQKGKPDFCFLAEEVGVCRGYITRYFYSNQSKQCESFKYGGCLGNLNNFESLEECKNTCEDALNDSKTQPDPVHNNVSTPKPRKVNRLGVYTPSWCKTPADRGLCKANERRFYYKSNIGRCLSFNYSGCGGNENNFISERACYRACKKGSLRKITKRRILKMKKKRKKTIQVGFENKNSTYFR
ncbi:tissue factor pathway inhibitor [Saccopteryx bilineata]|uniref:tissue factor pathway inhibitor n=1 Tax=Saccopteryx bilineata TaxID=59482 RepID=UPI00338FE7E0